MTCRLKIRLDVLADNYGKFVRALGGQTLRVAGVLKADGYGMGAVEVARRLTREGCRIFFSANVAEAMTLREAQIQEIIYVFSGPLSDQDVSVYKTNKLHRKHWFCSMQKFNNVRCFKCARKNNH